MTGWDRPLLTLFTDASHCPRTLATGWGAWAKADGWAAGAKFSGTVAETAANSGEAELWGVACALEHGAEAGWLAGTPTVMVQCDALRPLDLLVHHMGARPQNHEDSFQLSGRGGGYRVVSPSEHRALVRLRLVLEERTVLVRHVRGHQQGGTRQWVNNWCHSAAIRHMRQERQRVDGALQSPTLGL